MRGSPTPFMNPGQSISTFDTLVHIDKLTGNTCKQINDINIPSISSDT